MYEPTLKELAEKCTYWGARLNQEKLENTLLKIPKTDKYSRWDLTRAIISKTIVEYYGENIPWSAIHRNKMESAMMCERFTKLKESEQKYILESPEYYAEHKFNGHRCLIYYVPNEGFKFYANNRDTDSLLVVDNTQQILFIKNGKITKPEDYIDRFKSMFVLDGEVVCKSKYVDASAYGGEVTESELNAVGTLMQINPEASHEIQRTQKDCQLEFHIFDIIYYNQDIMNKPLKERNKIKDKLVEQLEKIGLPFYNTKRIYTDKQKYFDTLVDSGHEGIVIKNENEIYTPNKTRSKVRQIKYKRTLSGMLGDDIDAFIIGFEPSTEGKAFENYIGAIKLGVYLSTVEGNEILHHIASISGLPMELRKKMSIIDKETGKPTLNPEYLNHVLTIDGFAISAKNLRFAHAKVQDWNTCWRIDKTPDMCQLNEEVLRMQVL